MEALPENEVSWKHKFNIKYFFKDDCKRYQKVIN